VRRTVTTWPELIPQIDVHYSLPRADETNGPATREKNQVSVVPLKRQARTFIADLVFRDPYSPRSDGGGCYRRMISVDCASVLARSRRSSPRGAQSESPLLIANQTAAQLSLTRNHDSQKATIYDEMQDKPFLGGTLDLRFVWDELDPILPPP
jgi:hypothetical protein